MERDFRTVLETTIREHFNSHAHVERDLMIDIIQISKTISTHTLTWSVTVHFWNKMILTFISTHTLTWSVTL